MAEFPALPLWTDAYLGDTTHLTTLEHGAYLLLLIAMWRSKNHELPDDDKMLARYAKLTLKQWIRIKPVITAFFHVENSGDSLVWKQGRLTDEAHAVRQHSRKQSDRSKARWLKDKENGHAAGMPDGCRIDPSLPLPLPIKLASLDSTTAARANGEVPASSDAEVSAAKAGSQFWLPERHAGEVLPGGWSDFAEEKRIPDGQIYESWRKFKQISSFPYQLSKWRSWVERERF